MTRMIRMFSLAFLAVTMAVPSGHAADIDRAAVDFTTVPGAAPGARHAIAPAGATTTRGERSGKANTTAAAATAVAEPNSQA